MSAASESAESIIADLHAGSRRALSRSLSLIESTLEADRDVAFALLEKCTSMPSATWRIGCTGPPGVGKSSFIERLGCRLTDMGRRVAVLAVDPSSRRTGGSILGDKVRMPLLSQRSEAYIRPTPSKAVLGGASPSTREAILLCEEAGFDTIIIETVGVGQSEVEVASMVDMFLLLALPNSGDDVQGIKRGIMEVAHSIIVTKSDLDVLAAHRALATLSGALRYMHPASEDWPTNSECVSSTSGAGFDEVVQAVSDFFSPVREPHIERRRQQQRGEWFDRVLASELLVRLMSRPEMRNASDRARRECVSGLAAPSLSVHRLLGRFQLTIAEDV